MIDHIDAITDKNTKEFAKACYEMNTLDDLRSCFQEADKVDCKEFGLTEKQWFEAIEAARWQLELDNLH